MAPVRSSGAFGGPAPLDRLIIYASPDFSPEASHEVGDTSIGGWTEPGVRQFARYFAVAFSKKFPPMVAAHGVRILDEERGQPVLSVQVSAYQVQCRAACETLVRIDGSLIDGDAAEKWSFSDWLNPEEVDSAGFDKLLNNILAAMIHDGVISAANGVKS